MKIFLQNQGNLAEECISCLARKGSVLLLPTETVYGLVCSWGDEEAREKIYLLKNRPKEKLLGLFLPDMESLGRLLKGKIPEGVEKLGKKFMPGPLTIIIPDGRGGTIGFRIPDHPLLLEILKKSGFLLAQTSANASGTPPGKTVEDAMKQLTGEADLVVDGGEIPHEPLSSTVLLWGEDGSWKILREGPVTAKAIEETLKD